MIDSSSFGTIVVDGKSYGDIKIDKEGKVRPWHYTENHTVLADDINRSVILDQVEMGVAVRQAVLEILLNNKE